MAGTGEMGITDVLAKAGQLLVRWQRFRTQGQLHRELLAASPSVREDYLAALMRAES